ncbi:unnamed protein product [Notodromas monacha]|uniref:Uncharacterized protein n=1 Tax=Notodromas monacha TaxID=399045 RepID=A0A7R9BPG9_9CRUS|nr:unnamed protein product [Notodromas monacha]CAG0918416.1 unnamed protein product [Notodromas monacha]
MHDCCGVDEVMTSRARAKNRTAFPEGPTIQLESEPYAYQIVAYKTVLNIWAKEYVDEEVERRKLDKKSVLLRGMRLQKHLKEQFICDPALIMSRDLRLEVQRAEHLLGVELDRVRTLERNIPKIVELGRRLVCSWQKKKYLQEVIQVLSGHLRASPDGDTAITHMLELMEPSTDSYDFLRLFYSNLDGTSITETNPAMEPTFEPQLGHGVNFCEAKKLIHFMKYRHLHPWFKFPKKNKLGGAGLDVNDHGFKDFMKDDRFNFEHMIPQQQRGVEMGARRFRVTWDRRAKTALYKAMALCDSIRSLEHNMQLDYKAPRTVGDLFPHVAFVQRLDIDEALVSKPPTVEKYGIPEVSTRSPNFN